MSNHDGSRMLNDVIALLRREGVFERLGKAHSQRIVSEMVSRAYDEHDTRDFEVLDGGRFRDPPAPTPLECTKDTAASTTLGCVLMAK